MIEINLAPGATRSAKGRRSGFSLSTIAGSARTRVRDPYMLSAVGAVAVAAVAIASLHLTQIRIADQLAAREAKAVQDSTRFASVLRERRRAQAQRDSVLHQLEVIRAIDADRFIWPHIMDEVSRALPPYTWLQSIQVTNQQGPPATAATDSTHQDPAPASQPVHFRVIGNTVDIQALTRFMKLLEASPYIQNVQLAKSEMMMADGKDVTQFQLEAQYERPDSALVMTAPVSLSVR